VGQEWCAYFEIMRRTDITLNDYEMQHNEEVGLFTRPPKLYGNNVMTIYKVKRFSFYLKYRPDQNLTVSQKVSPMVPAGNALGVHRFKFHIQGVVVF
jgi:hypothetical protein